jgi:LysM repeat protein
MKIGKNSILISLTVLIGILLSSGCSLPFTTGGEATAAPNIATPIFITATNPATGPTVIVLTSAPQEAPITTAVSPDLAKAITATPTAPLVTATLTGTISPFLGSHTVASGESLYQIGRAYGVDPEAIAKENGIKKPFTIYKGDVLRIPPVRWTSIPSGPTAKQQFTPNWESVGIYNYVAPTYIPGVYYPSDH